MRSIFNPHFAEARRGRFRAIVGITLIVALALIGGRRSLAGEKSTTHVVAIENMKFSPSVLRVRTGDRIEFKNGDLVPHTATAKLAGLFDSGLVKPGESWIFVPMNPGTFGYTCTFHPMMVGELVVAER